MIHEIQAKTLLNRLPQPDPIFGLTYTMNLYRGCQHQCIYCDSRSLCYGIEDFRDISVKVNAPEVLRKELAGKRKRGTIGTGSMHDPYMPLEKKRKLTGEALEIMQVYHFPVHVMTKSDLVVRDLDILKSLSEVYAAVSFTITSADDGLGRKLEPGAASVSERLSAMRAFAEAGVLTGVSMMPILPFIEDTPANIEAIVDRAADHGARYIIAWMGMSLRDRQRAYYYDKLDALFPGLKERYIRRYGGRYQVQADQADRLGEIFQDRCAQRGIATQIPTYEETLQQQLPLL